MRYIFSNQDETIPIPRGTRSITITGTLRTPPSITPDIIYPLVGLRVGAIDGQRKVAATFCIGGKGQARIEHGAKGGAGGGTVPLGTSSPISFTWTPTRAIMRIGSISVAEDLDGTDARDGGRLFLGMDFKPKPGKPIDYSPLVGGEMEIEIRFDGADEEPPPGSSGTLADVIHDIETALEKLRKL